MRVGELTLEYINNISKTIDENGCWIPNLAPLNTGYVLIRIGGNNYYLHRLSMCLNRDISYYDIKIEARHSDKCSKACFYTEHITPGTHSDNIIDSVKNGSHYLASLEYCQKCGGGFTTLLMKSGDQKGKLKRYCKSCQLRRRKELRDIRRANR